MSKLIIKGELTDLNTYINQERTNRYMAAKTKSLETERVALECVAQRIKNYLGKINVSYHFFSPTNRKDEDNLLIAIKWINDGLVAAHVIPNDSRRFLHITAVAFDIDRDNPRIEVRIVEGGD